MQIITRQSLQDEWSKWGRGAKSIDFETNGLPLWNPSAKLVTISMAGVNEAVGSWTGLQIPVAHREGVNADPETILRFVELVANSRLIPFWVQMEASWLLAKFGVRPTWVGDAYYAARIAQLKEASLKDLTEKYLQRRCLRLKDVIPNAEEVESWDFSTVHAQDPKGIAYTIADSVNAGQLEAVLRGRFIAPQNMQAIYEIEIQSAAMMAEHSLAGYDVNMPVLQGTIDREEAALPGISEKIIEKMGVKPFAINSPTKLGAAIQQAWNLRSTRKTDKGADSWSQDVLQDLIAQTAVNRKDVADTLREIIDFKSRHSVLASLKKRIGDVSPDGKLHPQWETIGFDGTSRIYSKGPSMTSLSQPARQAFTAADGKIWVKFDYDQAEIRILCGLSGDTNLRDALATADFHSTVYAWMSNIPFAEVTPKQRESSKVISYSILYSGGSAWHVSQELGIPEEEAAELVGKYFALFPTLGTYLEGLRRTAASTLHVRTWLNRLRRLDGADSRRAQNQACNAAGQQSCGTLLKVAMLRLHNFAIDGHPLMKGFSQVIPVFDALFWQIDADVPLEAHVKFVRDLVELEVNSIKLTASFEVGKTWGSTEKIGDFPQAVADFVSGARPEYEQPGELPEPLKLVP